MKQELKDKFAEFLKITSSRMSSGDLSFIEAQDRLYRMGDFLKQHEAAPWPFPPAPGPKFTAKEKAAMQKRLDASAEKFDAKMRAYMLKQQIAEMDLMKDSPASRVKIETRNPVFMSSLYAICGSRPTTNGGFAEEMIEALRGCDLSFFESVADAIKTVKAITSRRKLKTADSTKTGIFAHHVMETLRIVAENESGGLPEPVKHDLEKIVVRALRKIGVAPFDDESDWRKVWKAAGVSHYEQDRHATNKTTCGKGRISKAYEGTGPKIP
jgi:hypothetical protein